MRADRLLAILMLLQSKGRMTAHDLADQLEVSERTIYRDLEALSIAGIPIYTERGPGGGCELLDGYQTRLTGLTTTEIRALFLFHLTAPLSALGLGKALESAFLKLSAALPADSRIDADRARQRFHIDTSWRHQDTERATSLPALQEAIWHDQKLCLIYSDDYGKLDEHSVEPYGLVSRATIWYLIARRSPELREDHDIYDIQVYPVSHIQHIIILEEHFTHPAYFDLASFWTTYLTGHESEESIPSLQPIIKGSRPTYPVHWNHGTTEQKKRYVPAQNQGQEKKRHIISVSNPTPIKKTAYFTDISASQEKKAPSQPELGLLATSLQKKGIRSQRKKTVSSPFKKKEISPISPLLCA